MGSLGTKLTAGIKYSTGNCSVTIDGISGFAFIGRSGVCSKNGIRQMNIFIFLTKDMVVTFTSSIPQGTYLPNYDLIEDFVLPATQPIIYSDVTSSNNQETPIRIDFIGCLIVLIIFQKRNKSISDVIA